MTRTGDFFGPGYARDAYAAAAGEVKRLLNVSLPDETRRERRERALDAAAQLALMQALRDYAEREYGANLHAETRSY